jgi:hypothetical protein
VPYRPSTDNGSLKLGCNTDLPQSIPMMRDGSFHRLRL